ncbi:MAG: hypothetical protein ACRDL2_14640 [Gaiellaceae bacterium]|jgi:hypothetical protein
MRLSDSDRVVDWRDEWRRIERDFERLPAEARAAVLRLVEHFRAEDGGAGERAA